MVQDATKRHDGAIGAGVGGQGEANRPCDARGQTCDALCALATPPWALDPFSQCVSILWQVDELDNAVKMSERDLDRFKLTPAEVAERRRWVEATRAGALGESASA